MKGRTKGENVELVVTLEYEGPAYGRAARKPGSKLMISTQRGVWKTKTRTESSEPLGEDVTTLLPLIWRRACDGLIRNSGAPAPLSVLAIFAAPTLLVLIRVREAEFCAWRWSDESGTKAKIEEDGGKRVSRPGREGTRDRTRERALWEAEGGSKGWYLLWCF